MSNGLWQWSNCLFARQRLRTSSNSNAYNIQSTFVLQMSIVSSCKIQKSHESVYRIAVDLTWLARKIKYTRRIYLCAPYQKKTNVCEICSLLIRFTHSCVLL